MAGGASGPITYSVTLTTTKLDELINGGLHKRATELVQYFALLILDLAQSFVPVDTGHLKASLQKGGEENIFEIMGGGLVAVIGTSVLYAVFVEFGTRRMSAQPYLTPAVEAVREEFAHGISSIFGSGVKVVGLQVYGAA